MTTAARRAEAVNAVDAYALEVVEGRIPAGKYHRLSCARHLADRRRECTPGFPYRFEWAHADRFLRFARLMKHYKGRQFSGQRFEPTPSQVFRLGSLFGWRHAETGFRRFTTAYSELPRKNGKSFEEAVVAVYVTFFEGEPGAEGYCIATKEKQARIVFDASKRLVKASGLNDRIRINAANLHRESTYSRLEPLGSDSDTTDGLNPHFVGVDELHAFKSRGLLDVMESATGARLNPLIFIITTAGDDLVSVCGDQHEYACQILEGTLDDDASTLAFFAFIAHADEGDDPWSETTWRKANPNYGVSVNPEDLRKLAAKAQKMPSAAAEFQQKRLNVWINSSAPCLSLDGWRHGQTKGWRPAFDVPDLHGAPCYVGIDLASKIDLCAVVLVFPPAPPARPRWRWIVQSWTPAETLDVRAHRDRAPYRVWVNQGWLLTTPGVKIDQRVIYDAVIAACELYDVQRIGYDEWKADKLIDDLAVALGDNARGEGEKLLAPIAQTFRGMSSACIKVQADILASEIDAGGCPVTTWCVGNVVGNVDGKDNLMFVKGKSRGRIDPVIAGTIATACALREPAPVEAPQYQAMIFGGGPRA
jgi:phage terminase large subunit-like protein